MPRLPSYRRVVDFCTGQPWLVTEEKLAQIAELLELRTAGGRFDSEAIAARTGVSPQALFVAEEDDDEQPLYQMVGGVAVVGIQGTLFPRATGLMRTSGMVSTADLEEAVRAAAADDAVRAIVLDVDSPGGAAQGVPELAEAIAAADRTKPVIAVASGLMASGAYWAGSAAREIVVAPSGQLGSIGALLLHTEYSAARQRAGVKSTLIKAGQFKGVGNDVEPLSEEARGVLQERIDAVYASFVAAVAAQRRVSLQTVLEQYGQGKVFDREEALRRRMADRGGTLREVIAELNEQYPARAVAAAGGIRMEKVMTKEIKEALLALGLIDALDAADATCETVVGTWYKARGKRRPKTAAEVLADLAAAKKGKAEDDEDPPGDEDDPASESDDDEEEASAQPRRRRPAPATAAEIAAASQRALAGERARIREIRARCQVLGLGPETADALIDEGVPLTGLSDRLLAAVTERDRTSVAAPAGLVIQGGRSATESFAAAALDGLRLRLQGHRGRASAGGRSVEFALQLFRSEEKPAAGAEQFRGRSLLDIASESLRRHGVRTELARSNMELAQWALAMTGAPGVIGASAAGGSYNTPGAFPNILSNLAGKMGELITDWAPATYTQWAAGRTVNDLKPHQVVRMGEFQTLARRKHGQKAEQASTSEEYTFIQADDYAGDVHLTWEMLVNDDLNLFTDNLSDLLVAAEMTLNELCVNLLVNGTTAPFTDGSAFFSNSVNNVSSGGAPSVTEASKMRTMLRKQKGVAGQRYLNLPMTSVLVPPSLETAAEQTFLSNVTVIPVTDATGNPFRGKVQPIVEPMLEDFSDKVWYGFAPPTIARSIIYANLSGFENPVQRSWYDDDTESQVTRVRKVCAAAYGARRGIVRNNGQ